jgi:heat shock protein HspQ
MNRVNDTALFFVGQCIKHKLFGYEGVIIDVDPFFMLSDEWYELMAKSLPPKDRPWYRILVHNSSHETYVAEQNLDKLEKRGEVNHPDIELYFDSYADGVYQLRSRNTN